MKEGKNTSGKKKIVEVRNKREGRRKNCTDKRKGSKNCRNEVRTNKGGE